MDCLRPVEVLRILFPSLGSGTGDARERRLPRRGEERVIGEGVTGVGEVVIGGGEVVGREGGGVPLLLLPEDGGLFWIEREYTKDLGVLDLLLKPLSKLL